MYYAYKKYHFHLLCSVEFRIQGHSTVSSLPPLPEAGPTSETAVLEGNQLLEENQSLEENQPRLVDPASAHSTAQDSREEDLGDEVHQVATDAAIDSDAEQAPAKKKRRRLTLVEESSAESKEEEQGDIGHSNAQGPVKDHSLNVPPPASRPSAASSEVPRIGFFALGVDPESDEDEESRFVLLSIYLLWVFLCYALFFDQLALGRSLQREDTVASSSRRCICCRASCFSSASGSRPRRCHNRRCYHDGCSCVEQGEGYCICECCDFFFFECLD